jgi:KRAB domain-containing zinc finger protein
MEAADEDEERNVNIAKFENDDDYYSMPMDYSQKAVPVKTTSLVVQDLRVSKPDLVKSLQCLHCPYTTDNKSSYEKHASFHNSSKKYECEWCSWSSDRLNMLYNHAQTIHPMELAQQERDASFCEKNGGKAQSESMSNDADDVDNKYDTEDTADEDVTTARRMSWSKRQDMSNIEKRRLEVRRESVGVEDDLPPEFRSKRRRRLKTCQKCGYITDNVTTLQRHMAKHGSKGKFTCSFCDYSVDRQHIVEYHIKIVHQPGLKPGEGDLDAQNVEAVDGQVNYEEHEEMEEDMEQEETFEDDDLKNHKILWEITKIKGHEMKIQRIGRKTTYHCLKCPLYTCNITNAVNHIKQHGAKKKYTCEMCDYSLDQLRHVMHHMKKVHTDFSFSDTGEDVDDSFSKPYDMDSSKEESVNMELMLGDNSQHVLTQRKGMMKKFGLGSPTPSKRISHTRYPCSKCSFVAHGTASLRKHVTIHKRFGNKLQCVKCDYKATTSKLLLIHCNMHHTQDN